MSCDYCYQVGCDENCILDQDEYDWACIILDDMRYWPFVCECCDKDLMDWLGYEPKKQWYSISL